jgi:NSS family neurotransmitter:Na+ symporter
MQARDGAKNRPATGAKRPAGDDAPDGWSSPRLFVLAAAGAAIGFNNFWQFPAITAQYGGGAFLIVYVACVAVLGLPLLMAEFMLGRRGRASPIATFRRLAQASRSDPNWVVVGWLGVIGSFLVFCYLNVFAGWTLAFALRSALGTFSGLTADGVAALFTALVRDPEKQLFWHALFVGMTMVVVARGVRDGIEPVTRWALPLALVLLAGLAVYAATTNGMVRALSTVFLPDFTRLSAVGLIMAAGHAFFSLGLGASVMLMYSAYADGEFSTARAAVGVAAIDTVVGLVAALTVFALLYAGAVDPAAGPALVFQAMPLVFDHLEGGRVLGAAFFVLLAIIAWLAAIALAQPAVAWLQEWRAWTRLRAAVACGAVAWLLGICFILSFNHWAFSFPFFDSVKKFGLFDVAQILTAHTLLPLCGILTALFAGWALRPVTTREWLGMRSLCGFDAWLWLNRLGVALLLAIVILNFSDLFA